jgi:hypothetical protein
MAHYILKPTPFYTLYRTQSTSVDNIETKGCDGYVINNETIAYCSTN